MGVLLHQPQALVILDPMGMLPLQPQALLLQPQAPVLLARMETLRHQRLRLVFMGPAHRHRPQQQPTNEV